MFRLAMACPSKHHLQTTHRSFETPQKHATSQNADILALLVAVAARGQLCVSRQFREVLLQQGRVPAVLTSIKQVRVAAAVNKENPEQNKKTITQLWKHLPGQCPTTTILL